MGIGWWSEIRYAFIKFIGYDLHYLKSGMYIIVLNIKIFDLLKFVIA